MTKKERELMVLANSKDPMVRRAVRRALKGLPPKRAVSAPRSLTTTAPAVRTYWTNFNDI